MDFNFSKIFACSIFGAIGFVAFVYGKKKALARPMILRILLMVYPYIFSSNLAVYLIGLALTAALYFWRE